jgi:hypothetical protein
MLPLSQTWRYHNQIADVFNAITAERCIGRPERPSTATMGDTIVLCGTNKEVDAAVKQLRDLANHLRSMGALQVARIYRGDEADIVCAAPSSISAVCQ